MTAPGQNALRYCDIEGGPTLPVAQLSQASPTLIYAHLSDIFVLLTSQET